MLTSYLVSNAIVLPISGWLAGAIWTQAVFHELPRYLYRELVALRCGSQSGFSSSLPGSARRGRRRVCSPWRKPFWPTLFRHSNEAWHLRFMESLRSWRPTIGPTLGGWITFNYSWRWIFFINLPVGVMTWLLVRRFVEDPPYLQRLKDAGVKLDYIGIALLALGSRCIADSAG